VPNIDLSRINPQSPLHQFSKFVNTLSEEADNKQIPQLKGLALFSSMLLFHLLLDEEVKHEPERIFVERHPLIDTLVYARFYASKLHPDTVDTAILQELDQQYETELGYLMYLADVEAGEQGATAALLQFVYQAFHAEPITNLAGLFCVDLPDEMYYLEADPEILYSRLAEREIKEAHESVEVLQQLKIAYDEILTGLADDLPIHRINANDLSQLDALYVQLANG
ncbi:MAG: hypothetical protein AAFQ68_27860, partial [Bacteroidota bacterium]